MPDIPASSLNFPENGGAMSPWPEMVPLVRKMKFARSGKWGSVALGDYSAERSPGGLSGRRHSQSEKNRFFRV
jgi:hypothetical protein